jgi:hypothetical protein
MTAFNEVDDCGRPRLRPCERIAPAPRLNRFHLPAEAISALPR